MLALKDLKAGYAGKTVVALDHLALKAGSKCLVRGPSGSGKTTLLYAIAGLAELQKGDVSLEGIALYQLKEAARDRLRGEKIGIVFQNLNLVKSLTVLENILLGSFLTQHDQNIARAEELLAKLGIAELEDRQTTDISQGQAQRVAIARALLNKPALLLADEPTSSLDDQSAARVIGLLMALTRETNTTLVVSTHDARICKAFDQTLNLGAAA